MPEKIQEWIENLRLIEEGTVNFEELNHQMKSVEQWLSQVEGRQQLYGNFFLGLGNLIKMSYPEAEQHFKSAHEICQKETGNEVGLSIILEGFIATTTFRMSQTQSVWEKIQVVKAKIEKECIPDEVMDFQLRLGICLADLNWEKEDIWDQIRGIHGVLLQCGSCMQVVGYNQLAILHMRVFHNTIGAVYYLQEALKLAKSEKLVNLEANIRGDLGVCYSNLEDHNQAIACFEPLIKDKYFEGISKIAYYRAAYSLVLNGLYSEQYGLAKAYLDVMEGINQLGDQFEREQLEPLFYLCQSQYYALSDSTSIEKAKECIVRVKQYNSTHKENTVFTNMEIIIHKIEGDIYFKMGDYHRAYEIHDNGLQKSKKSHQQGQVSEFYRRLAYDSQGMGNYEKAVFYYKKYMEYKRSAWEKQRDQYIECLLSESKLHGKRNQLHDLTQRQKLLKNRRNQDSLTGVANRRYLNEIFERGQIMSEQLPYTAIMIDVDSFKLYNDHYGHLKGDDVLRNLGRVLQEYFNEPKQVIGRYGGEEFLILCPQTTAVQAMFRIKEMMEAIRNLKIPHEYSPVSPYVTVSVGIMCQDGQYLNTYEALIEKADHYLYKAKQNGKNQVFANLKGC